MYTWMDIKYREEDRRERLLGSRGVSRRIREGRAGRNRLFRDSWLLPRLKGLSRRHPAPDPVKGGAGAVRIRLGLSLIRLGRRLAFPEVPGEEPRSA